MTTLTKSLFAAFLTTLTLPISAGCAEAPEGREVKGLELIPISERDEAVVDTFVQLRAEPLANGRQTLDRRDARRRESLPLRFDRQARRKARRSCVARGAGGVAEGALVHGGEHGQRPHPISVFGPHPGSPTPLRELICVKSV